MKKSRFSETKIVSVLAPNESGEKVKDLCRELEISEATWAIVDRLTRGNPNMED